MTKKELPIQKKISQGILKIFLKKQDKKKQVLEVAAGKPRVEEEKFYEKFSVVQMNAVLLLILAATFLTTGLTRYAEVIGQTKLIDKWLILIIFSIILLVISIISVALGGVLVPLKDKRLANTVGFSSFLFGASIFFISLVLLILFLI